jgi:hypothetical protein
MGTEIQLDNDRRKAVRQLLDLGFRLDEGRGDYKLYSPEGLPIGRFSLAGKHAKVTPDSLRRRFKEWQRKTGRFSGA